MKLTEHFSLQEFVTSATASRKGIDNTPTEAVVSSLQILANELEKVRVEYGQPITISSGYRCPKLNKAVGGVSNSQHMKGEAADLQAADLKKLYSIIVRHDFDQVLFEHKGKTVWIHASRKASGNRHQFISNYVVK